jgi:ferredoxin-type protein NapG
VTSTRRELFARFLRRPEAIPEREVPAKPPAAAPSAPAYTARPVPVLRPPGACAEVEFLANCTRCGDCITACPFDAIVLAPDRLRTAAGTPIIAPANQPCWLCLDQPCATACKPGVLSRERPPAIGKAMIQPMNCLNAMGTTCSICVERCPVPDAISMRGGKPHIIAAICTGCGVCQYACPAPVNAILVLPTLDRPAMAPKVAT